MMVNGNLLDVTQNFISPEIVKKFSSTLGEPIEKTKTALRSAIPTLLLGIAKRGSTPEGAQSVVNLAKQHPIETDLVADEVQETNLYRGIDFLGNIFGNNLGQVVSKIGLITGLNPTSVTKLMGIAAPLVLGVIGNKVKNENLNATGLMSFFNREKGSLDSLLPKGLTDDPEELHYANYSSKPWGVFILVALALMATLWWFFSRDAGQREMKVAPAVTSATLNAKSHELNELSNFLQTGKRLELPRNFHLNEIKFQEGTTIFLTGSENELDFIANSMKEYPASHAKIQVYSNEALESEQVSLALRRATAIKKQLVVRGLGEDRIETSVVDPGPHSDHHGIEFVVTNI